MPNLVGIGLSQVPTNGMLGGMAYQDPEHASIKNLDLKNLSQINSEIADTAVDVFVYDTSKDSDGGAWRKRTQNTSWYNETLNTTTRGSRKEFPAVAVIVAEATKVTIYDGDDPNLPMWMVFTWSGASVDNLLGYNNRAKSAITAVNGYLITCSDPDGIHIARFIHDDGIRYTHVNHVYTSDSIANRTNTVYTTINTTSLLVASTCNDIAATVLPNAPIDDTTGLPVPTIAVATQGGVSVITDSGTVIDITSASGGNYHQSKAITITEENYLWWLGDYNAGSTYLRDSYAVSLDNLPSSNFTWNNTTDNMSAGKYYALTTNGEAGEIKIGSGNTWAWNHQERNALGGPAGLAIHKPNIGSETNSLIAAITSDYNTGWMHGDCKGAFLSDTTAETMNRSSATELVTNGTSWTGASGTTAPNGWTSWGYAESAFTIDSGTLRIGNGAANNPTAMHQNITTVVGQVYTFYFSYQVTNAQYAIIRVGTANLNGNLGQLYGTVSGAQTSGTLTFVATGTTTNISVQLQATSGNSTINIDNLSVKAVGDVDRSVNNNGLAVYGTITKTPVATGAELVGYSGFTASSYLRYNASDMAFGTGDFSVSVWCIPSTDESNEFILELDDASSSGNNRFYFLVTNTSTKRLYLPWDSDIAGSDLTPGQWNHVVVGRKSGYGFVYVNNRWIADGYKPYTMDLEGNGFGTISNYSAGPSNDYAWSGSLALMRISGSAPSAEQVSKMYHDEKCLFHENAKATLYGSSDAVTALAFDDTTNLLHVGTSAGRSEFQGIRRINNTTDAVTTAISASNGLVAEQ